MTARELLEDAVHCIYLGTEHGRRTHAAIVEHLRADEPRVAEGRDPFDAFVAGFKMRHEWPAESPVDLLDLAAAVHATRSLQHKADVEPLRCGSCRDEALAILIALDAAPRKTNLPAPRPPEFDRTAALTVTVKATDIPDVVQAIARLTMERDSETLVAIDAERRLREMADRTAALRGLVAAWSGKAAALRLTRSERHIGQGIGLAEAASALDAALAAAPEPAPVAKVRCGFSHCMAATREYHDSNIRWHCTDHEWDPQPVAPVAEMPEDRCPVCWSSATFRLPPDWQDRVDRGQSIPIVGCGNPWHYADREGPRPPGPVCSADIDEVVCGHTEANHSAMSDHHPFAPRPPEPDRTAALFDSVRTEGQTQTVESKANGPAPFEALEVVRMLEGIRRDIELMGEDGECSLRTIRGVQYVTKDDAMLAVDDRLGVVRLRALYATPEPSPVADGTVEG